MSDATVEEAFSDYVKSLLSGTPAFTSAKTGKVFSFYTSGEKGNFNLPCMSFELPESKPLCADARAGEGVLTIWIETQADDESEEVHEARVAALLDILRQRVAVRNGINAARKIRVYGYTLGRTSRELKARHWISGIDIDLGFGVPRPLP